MGASVNTIDTCCYSNGRHGGSLASGRECPAVSVAPSHAVPCWVGYIPHSDGQPLELQLVYYNRRRSPNECMLSSLPACVCGNCAYVLTHVYQKCLPCHGCRCVVLSSSKCDECLNMRCRHAFLHIQVCGVFALFLSGAHNFIWWGLYCYPRTRTITLVAYFLTAGACILAGLTAKNNAKRAAPMLVLLLLRFFVVLARLMLNSGSWWASINFLWMEVSSLTYCHLSVPLLHFNVSLCCHFLAVSS